MSFKWLVLFGVMVAKCTASNCSSGQLGNPKFHCYPQSASYCGIVNDPSIDTFSKEHAKVKVLGTLKVAEFSVEKPTEEGVEKCAVTVWAVTDVVQGKIFIAGFRTRIIRQDADTSFQPSFYEFEVKQNVTASTIEWTAGFRTSPSASFNFRYSFVSDGVPSSDVLRSVGSCDISYTLTNDGFFILEFPCCQVRVGFRPNIHGQRHTLYPGLWVEVDDPNILFPNWTPGHEPLCLTNGPVNISSIRQSTGAATATEALAQLAFSNADGVALEGNPPSFVNLAANLKICSVAAKRQLFEQIGVILGSAGFVKCISNGVQEVLASFLVLLEKWVCLSMSESCNQAKSILLVNCSTLVSSNAVLNAFVNAPC